MAEFPAMRWSCPVDNSQQFNLEMFMSKQMNGNITKSRSKISCFAIIVLLATTLGTHPVTATTYISVEPIPSQGVVGQDALAKILSVGYRNLELWSNRLLDDCDIVQNVIDVLASNGAISTVNHFNTRFRVGAGGFEAVTNPTYVVTIQDSGHNAVSAKDVGVLDNALGYVLNQGGTTHFSPDNANAYDFQLDYAVVTFKGRLTGEEAKEFFDFLGTIDPALWNANFAGFTQIDFHNSPKNNSMLFLQPAVDKKVFVGGLFSAVLTTRDTKYFPLDDNREPTTATAGVSFPANDWITFPKGDQYLANLGNPGSLRLLKKKLAALRQQHLHAVTNLVNAIENGKVSEYLNDHQFKCPEAVIKAAECLCPTAGREVPCPCQSGTEQTLAPDAGDWRSVASDRVGGPGAGEAQR